MKRFLPWIVVIGCGSSEPPRIPPGTVLTPPDPPAKKKGGFPRTVTAVSDAGAAPALPNLVNASFMDIGKDKKHVDHVACEVRALSLVKGKAEAAGEKLSPGDTLVTQGKGGWDVTGEGLAVLAVINTPQCEPSQYTTLSKKVVHAKDAPPLVWANGGLKANLDVEGPNAYIGRLEGTAPVAEHAHETSWETLCAVEAKGTLTLAGASQQLGPKTCVQIPPNTKHAWTPDAGSKLVAIQIYSPPGPEQRFKALAAAAVADAGAPSPTPKPTDAGAAAPKDPSKTDAGKH